MFTSDLINYKRFKSRTVEVGNIGIGYANPIRIQTMTNTLLSDIQATVEQVKLCFENGADLVRISIPSMNDIENLKTVISKIHQVIVDKPIIADIHFSPEIAMAACDIVEKVRINPGNFVKSNKKSYTDDEYKAELLEIEKKLVPLLEKCKKNGKAIRIGTNYGSLSQRIIYKYGNTVEGLVNATLEYIEICRKHDFHDIIVSIKASNPVLMVQANRLLVEKMTELGWAYPLHLGVTEAGSNIEGRIKSAVGIGALLIDGIGDTIRVSLTEAPEKELPVCQKIVNHIKKYKNSTKLPEVKEFFFNPFSFERRETYQIKNIGGSKTPVVFADATTEDITFGDFKPDYIITSEAIGGDFWLSGVKTIVNYYEWNKDSESLPLLTVKEYLDFDDANQHLFVKLTLDDLTDDFIKKLKKFQNAVLIVETKTDNIKGELRLFFHKLISQKCKAPVILKLTYDSEDLEEIAIKSAIDSSIFLIDGLTDGIFIDAPLITEKSKLIDLSFDILQASHRRLSKTEFISCPSCGRTHFDLETVTEKIKERLSHLKGLKIAIMGCIVNGPGEIADADYGYIGSGKNKISLYKGKKLVKKNIDEKIAVDELINLIKENGDWIDV